MPSPATTSSSPRSRKSQLPKFIEKYYAELAELAQQNVMYEMGTRPATHSLLAAAGKEHGWTLIAEHEKKIGTGPAARTIRPDGTFKDQMNLVRGYWEAKDTADDLNREIEKKRKAGYPLTNIIFEDTQTAVLYQHGQRIESLTCSMKEPEKLAALIRQFFAYVEPEIAEFEHAVDEFKQRVPDLAKGLESKIAEAHKANPNFRKAFADFFELCKTSLNPNLSQAAVDEMLIQHILTERLIREIFDNPEFVRRNVIAAEVEKVMLAMTSQSFDRNTYLRELDRFYIAIERAARTMTDFSDKQHFLNTVYERFFQGYSVKLADTMGIVYTPQEIVDFMCASVAEVLEKEFGKKLWSDDVYIIDPCTGTGNFIVNLIRRIPKNKLEEVYRKRLFANEIMLLPYYIAALNIEHAYYEQAGTYEPFEGLCFVDTLDLAQGRAGSDTAIFDEFFNEKNAQRVSRQKKAPITVVIGNPPYNAHQENENDNNKNRKYPIVDKRISETYAKDSKATLKAALGDAYVKFFRYAIDRLEGRDGIVCFVSNNSFVDQNAFDGMRKHLMQDFSTIYHVDLHGNVRQNPKLSGTTHNVFGIQVGVGVTVAVRAQRHTKKQLCYHRVVETWRKEEKLQSLAKACSVSGINWQQLSPDINCNWLRTENSELFASFAAIGSKAAKSEVTTTSKALFALYSPGVNSSRDDAVYGWDASVVARGAKSFCEAYCAEVDRLRRSPPPENIDDFIDYSKVKWSSTLKLHLQRATYAQFDERKMRRALYRPFAHKHLYYDEVLLDRPGLFSRILPQKPQAPNTMLVLTNCGSEKPFMVGLSDAVSDYHFVGAGAGAMCFPFYVYDENGSNRRENITDWALKTFRDHYKDNKLDKWAIFYYVYGLLHHPGYREKFADNLKRELPRIPFAPDFHAFSDAGKKLAALHLDYEKLKPWDLEYIETPGEPLSYKVEKMRLSKDKRSITVNKSLTLAGIPPEVFSYRLGNRSALEWVIDQYQVCTDARSGIISDPNRQDDPQYIVRLVGQVVRVSVDTCKVVAGLPKEFSAE